MSIAITGATGQLGRLVIEQLKQRVAAQELLALARRPEQAQALGVAARAFDYDQPQRLAGALDGVDTLLLISASEVSRRAAQHARVINAARTAGVRRIVYTSLLHADTSPLNLAEEHRFTEQALNASGLPFTILRNGWYAENYTGSLAMALANGAVIGSAGSGRIAAAARADFAEAAAVVLTTDGHANATLELAGDSAWTLAELAAELSRQTGRNIPYRDLPEAGYAAALAAAGVPETLAAAIASWDAATARGALDSSDHTLSALIARPTTPLAVSVERALKAAG